LVIDATSGEFEAGFNKGGQTREHALLLRSLGVNEVVIAVNKMDNVGWKQHRFDEIVGSIKSFLVGEAGFNGKGLKFVPISGFLGENLVKRSEVKELVSWYSGPSLLELIGNVVF
jgi:elongation factor 1 alpha-like protein